MLQNHMINEAAAVGEQAPIRAEWIIDGMAAVQSVSPKDKWGNMQILYLDFACHLRDW